MNSSHLLIEASRRAGTLRILLTRKETILHKAADSHVPKMTVAVRYAFAKGRKALGHPPNAARAASAVHDALMEVLPPTLLKVLESGGDAGLTLLKKQLRTAGGPGSGNFNHGGRPGERGGSESDGSAALSKLKETHGEVIPQDAIFSYYDINHEAVSVYTDGIDTSHNGTVEDVKLSTLYATQDEVDATGLQHYLSGTGRSKEEPVVLRMGGKNYLVEGHHRAGAAILQGKSTIKAEVYDAGKLLGLKGKEPIQLRFDVTNPKATEWAKKHAGELAKGISATTEDAIKVAVARATDEGDLETLYDDILAAVGDETRADMIARTEVMAAANEGQRQSWDQAVDEGLLTGNEKVEWIATEGTLCDLCENLDGELRDLDGEYPDDGGEGPPLHPRCRCTEGISAMRAAGGAGSGNFGHAGRPGEKGGSGESNTRPTSTELTSAIVAIQRDRTNFADEESESEKLWRRDGALEAIEKVLTNQQRANLDPELAKNSFFAYKLDKNVVGGVSAAIHAKLEGSTVELKWVGSIRKGQGRALIEDSIRWAKSQGATELKGTSKYGSISYYERTYGAVKTSKEDPFTTNYDFKIELGGLKSLATLESA